jgi:hypothetical protein
MSDPSRPLPFQLRGACDGNLVTSELAENMSFCVKYGCSCNNTPFSSEKYFKEHLEWIQYKDYVHSRPIQPWTIFSSTNNGDVVSSNVNVSKKRKHKNKMRHNHTIRNNDVK